ncbi:MAG: hypothetical protein WBX15_10495 [Thermoanaerobaculia bacterium]
MLLLTEDAAIVCTHELGHVKIEATQDLVTIGLRKVLVERDPENRSISGCPNTAPTIKPCTMTLTVITGYSPLLLIEGRRICLDEVTGFTDGTPPGVVRYEVRQAGQSFVSEQPA